MMVEMDQLRDDVLNESPAPPDGMPRSGETSDPTFNKVMKLNNCARINYIYRITYAIGNVVWSLPPEKLKLVQLKYWTKPQQLTDTGIAIKLNCGRKTYYRWRDEICKAIAFSLGWY